MGAWVPVMFPVAAYVVGVCVPRRYCQVSTARWRPQLYPKPVLVRMREAPLNPA